MSSNTPFKLAEFVNAVGRLANDFYLNPEKLDRTYDVERRIYQHAVYACQVIQGIFPEDSEQFGFEKLKGHIIDAAKLQYGSSQGRSTTWIDTDRPHESQYVVRSNEDGSFSFYNCDWTSSQILDFNKSKQYLFERHNAAKITFFKEAVEKSNPRSIRDYSYRGETPYGKSWSRTDVQVIRDSPDQMRERFSTVFSMMEEAFGDEDQCNGWIIERDSHWAVGWVDTLGIEIFFHPNHAYTLTPIALYWHEFIYKEWPHFKVEGKYDESGWEIEDENEDDTDSEYDEYSEDVDDSDDISLD